MFTQEVPDENILKESRGFETMQENLLQGPDEAVLPTKEEGETSSLCRAKTTRKGKLLQLIIRIKQLQQQQKYF